MGVVVQYGNGIYFEREITSAYTGELNYNIQVENGLNYQVLNGNNVPYVWMVDTITIPTYARWDTVLHLKTCSESGFDYLRIIDSGTTTADYSHRTAAISVDTFREQCGASSVDTSGINLSNNLQISGSGSTGTIIIRDTGGRTITVKILYRKDGSGNTGTDSGYWAVTYTNTSSSSASIGFIRDTGITSIVHNGEDVSGYGADNLYSFTLGDSFLINSSTGIIRIEHNGSLLLERQADEYVFQPLEGGTYLINGSTGEGTITGRQLAFSTNWDVYETEFNDGIIPDVYFTITNNVDDNALTYHHEDIISIGDEFAEIIPANTTELYISTGSLDQISDYGIAGIEVNGGPVSLGDYSGGNLTRFPVTVSPSGNVTLRINFGPLEGQVEPDPSTTRTVTISLNDTSNHPWSLSDNDIIINNNPYGPEDFPLPLSIATGVTTFTISNIYGLNDCEATMSSVAVDGNPISLSAYTQGTDVSGFDIPIEPTGDVNITITISDYYTTPTRYKIRNTTGKFSWSANTRFDDYQITTSEYVTIQLTSNVANFRYAANTGSETGTLSNSVEIRLTPNTDNTIDITNVTLKTSVYVTSSNQKPFTLKQGNNTLATSYNTSFEVLDSSGNLSVTLNDTSTYAITVCTLNGSTVTSTNIPIDNLRYDVNSLNEINLTIESTYIPPTRYKVVNESGNSSWSINGISFNTYYDVTGSTVNLNLSDSVTEFSYKINNGATYNVSGNETSIASNNFNANQDNIITITNVTVFVEDTIRVENASNYTGDIIVKQNGQELNCVGSAVSFDRNSDITIETPGYYISIYSINYSNGGSMISSAQYVPTCTISSSNFIEGANEIKLLYIYELRIKVILEIKSHDNNTSLKGVFKVIPQQTDGKKLLKTTSEYGVTTIVSSRGYNTIMEDTNLYQFIAWVPGITYRNGTGTDCFNFMTWKDFLEQNTSNSAYTQYYTVSTSTSSQTTTFTIVFNLHYINPNREKNGLEQNKLLNMKEMVAYCYGLDADAFDNVVSEYDSMYTSGHCPTVGMVREYLRGNSHPFQNSTYDWTYTMYNDSLPDEACLPIKKGTTTYIDSNTFWTNQTEVSWV